MGEQDRWERAIEIRLGRMDALHDALDKREETHHADLGAEIAALRKDMEDEHKALRKRLDMQSGAFSFIALFVGAGAAKILDVLWGAFGKH